MPNSILEPRQEYPTPPPLVLHTVDEETTHSPAAPVATKGDAKPTPSNVASEADAMATAEQKGAPENTPSTSVSVSRSLTTLGSVGDAIEKSSRESDGHSHAAVTPQSYTDITKELAPPEQLLYDCEYTEAEERGVVQDLEVYELALLKRQMEEEDTATRARRELVPEFESTPPQYQHNSYLNQGDTLSSGDFSDQVSATSDDELSQRALAHGLAPGSKSTSRRRHRRSASVVSDPQTHSFDRTADEQEAREEERYQVAHSTAPGILSTVTKSVTEPRSAEDTLSLLTLTHQGPAQAGVENRNYLEAEAAAEEELRALAEEEERAWQRLVQREAADKIWRQEERMRQCQEREQRAAFACQSLQDGECLAREALVRAEADVREHYRCNAEEWLTKVLPHELALQRRAHEEAEAAAAAAAAQAAAAAAEAEAQARVEAEAAAEEELRALAEEEERAWQRLVQREAADKIWRQEERMRQCQEREQRAAFACQSLQDGECLAREALVRAEADVREHYRCNAEEWLTKVLPHELALQRRAHEEAEAAAAAAAAQAAAAAAEAEAQARVGAEAAAEEELRALAEEEERAWQRLVQREAADKIWRQEERMRQCQEREQRAAFACQSLQDGECLAREALVRAEADVREHYRCNAEEWLTKVLPHELALQRRAHEEAEAAAAAAAAQAAAAAAEAEAQARVEAEAAAEEELRALAEEEERAWQRLVQREAADKIWRQEERMRQCQEREQRAAFACQSLQDGECLAREALVRAEADVREHYRCNAEEWLTKVLPHELALQRRAHEEAEAAAAAAAAQAAAAAAEAEAQARVEAEAAAEEELRALVEEEERAWQRLVQREAADKIWRQEERMRQCQEREQRAAFACQSLQDGECLAREALVRAEAAVREHYRCNAEEWLTKVLPHELALQRRAHEEAEAAAAAAAAQAAAAAAAEAEAQARVGAEVAAEEELRALAEEEERAWQRLVQREAADKIWRQEERMRQCQEREQRAAFACQSLQDGECLAREALVRAEAAVREHYRCNAEEWLTKVLPHELALQRRAHEEAEAAAAAAAAQAAAAAAEAEAQARVEAEAAAEEELRALVEEEERAWQRLVQREAADKIWRQEERMRQCQEREQRAAFACQSLQDGECLAREALVRAEADVREHYRCNAEEWLTKVLPHELALQRRAHEEAEAAAAAAAEAEAQARVEAEAAAEEELRALAEEEERAWQRLVQREAADKIWRQEERMRQCQEREQRAAFACQSLQDGECLAREALVRAEADVREHYRCNAEEWLTKVLPHELALQRLAHEEAEYKSQQAQLSREERLGREEVVADEANSWSWLLSGARVERVVAATEEGDRVQREYEEMRYERARYQLHEDTTELVHEEASGRASFLEYEAVTRSLLHSHYAAQQQALEEDQQRQEALGFKKAAARREAALRQRCQWELDELDADEVGGRAMLCELWREERRTLNLLFLQRLVAIQRKKVLLQDAAVVSAAAAAAEETPATSIVSDVPTITAAEVHRRVQPEHRTAGPLAIPEGGDADNAHADLAGAATPPQPRTPLSTAAQLEELREREASYAAELGAALERLREAECRVVEEAASRKQAEKERQAAHVESVRLLQEAEQRAEQRIREARDTAEQLLQAQLVDLRDEATRRAEHAVAMQALAEEEQRAVLEAKLQAAQRQLEEAQQRVQEELRRAREEAAAMAAAEAAREARRREDEWQERCRADHLLRLAEKESEKEETVRRLAEIEAHAVEAVRQAREEAARISTEAQERLAEMERRQQTREAEVQLAAQRVRNARRSLREFDSRSQSSWHTTPSKVGHSGQKPPASSSRREAVPSLFAESSTHASQAPSQTPPLAPSSRTSSAIPHQLSTPRAAAETPALMAPTSTAPQIILNSQHTPVSAAVAPGPRGDRAAVPSSSASAADTTSLTAMNPVDIIRAAIRSAVQEIVEAHQRTQTLQDSAEQHVELSERRYHRRQVDRVRAARNVAEIESSYVASEMNEGEDQHQLRRQVWRPWAWQQQQQQQQQQARPHQPLRGRGDYSRTGSSLVSEERLQPGRSSRGGYANELSESPWTCSSLSPVTPTAAALETPAIPDSEGSNALLSASSVYFDSSYRPTAANLRTAHPFYGHYSSHHPAGQEQEQKQTLKSFTRYSAASRVLFAPRVVPQEFKAWAAENGEHNYARSTPADIQARAYPCAASLQKQRYATEAAPLPQPPRHAEGTTAPVSSVAHAYNEPEPLPPAPAAMDYSPPARRSATRIAPAAESKKQHNPPSAGANDGAGSGIGALPEPSRMCPRCYRTDTTSPCWRCGEIICQHCGLPPGSARMLCCTAHHRAQLRDVMRSKTYENGSASTAAGAGNAPPPLSAPQQQQEQRRREQQVQTSFVSSTESVLYHHAEPLADEMVARLDVGTSPLSGRSQPGMIPPQAYRVQQQQPRPRAQQSDPSMYPRFTMGGPGGSPHHLAYSLGYPPVAAAYPYAYPHPPPPQKQHPLPPHTIPVSLDPYTLSLSQPQPEAPFGYSVRAATAALGNAAPGSVFSAAITSTPLQQQEEAAAVVPGSWKAHGLPPSESRPTAASVAGIPHAPPAGLTQSPPPPSALSRSHQEVNEVMTLGAAVGDAAGQPAAPTAAVMDGTPDAQVQRQQSLSIQADDCRTSVEAKPPAAAVPSSATASISSPGHAAEKQGDTTTRGNTESSPDVMGVAALSDRDGVSAMATSATAAGGVLEEPKTERKKTFPAFFVSLGSDVDGGSPPEPRRPKPPTPRNFVPSQLMPPDMAKGPPPKRQRRRFSPSGMLLTSQSRSGGQGICHQPRPRKSPPLQTYELNCTRNLCKTARPSHNFGGQRRQLHRLPSPYEQAPNARSTKGVWRRTANHPPSPHLQRQHAPVNDMATAATKSSRRHSDSLAPMVVMGESGPRVVYEDVRKVESDKRLRQQQEQSATATRVVHDIYLNTGRLKRGVAEAEHHHLESRQDSRKLDHCFVEALYQPHVSSKQLQQQQQQPLSSRSESYYPYTTSSGMTSEIQSHTRQEQHHRYAPSQSHVPAGTAYAVPVVDRRVPTLAELDRRLQQLRLEDDYEASQYNRRQMQHVHRQQQQQQRIHVSLHSHEAVSVGGNTEIFVPASSYASREIEQPQRKRHNSATGRRPQQRTVSPPWRTDLNSSPVRPRWDISQPRLPFHHPAPATTAAN
ncbi:hypothetical protein JKF63_05825 [Porcisia hertigi]|uniref:Uncharacterized protein n=1 Tax=Porcisia hertigi TaxID=2761500 RepID=A0A836LCK5_9TRYP|nr:hypothetical protein JKF63_05825 [Porcisia hertigi]